MSVVRSSETIGWSGVQLNGPSGKHPLCEDCQAQSIGHSAFARHLKLQNILKRIDIFGDTAYTLQVTYISRL